MEIKQFKKEFKLQDKDIADMFGLSLVSYRTSSAKKRYDAAVCKVYDIVVSHEESKENIMDIKQLKKELNLKGKDLSDMLGLSHESYRNSSAKERYEEAFCAFYSLIKQRTRTRLVREITQELYQKLNTKDTFSEI